MYHVHHAHAHDVLSVTSTFGRSQHYVSALRCRDKNSIHESRHQQLVVHSALTSVMRANNINLHTQFQNLCACMQIVIAIVTCDVRSLHSVCSTYVVLHCRKSAAKVRYTSQSEPISSCVIECPMNFWLLLFQMRRTPTYCCTL